MLQEKLLCDEFSDLVLTAVRKYLDNFYFFSLKYKSWTPGGDVDSIQAADSRAPLVKILNLKPSSTYSLNTHPQPSTSTLSLIVNLNLQPHPQPQQSE